jgi:predicted transcriptional regulator
MMSSTHKIPIPVFLTPESIKKLETLARARNSKVSALIREAVEIWLAEPKQKLADTIRYDSSLAGT